MDARGLAPNTRPSRPPNPALPYREDCWSEGETSTLVDAWGERYVELNRGNLRQKHWQEVADAVNSRPGAGRRPARSDVQCKNRIDTLKKKFKAEKAKNGGVGSQWPFFERLDTLIRSPITPAPAPPSSKKQSYLSSPPSLALPLPFNRKVGPLPTATVAVAAAAAAAAASSWPVEVKREQKERPLAAIAADDMMLKRAQAAAEAAENDVDESDDEVESGSPSGSSSGAFRGVKRGIDREEEGIQELAQAIKRFAEIYERVEAAKQRQMMELEKQRMEFAKELEFQRMQSFVDSQFQLEKFKRAKRSDPDD